MACMTLVKTILTAHNTFWVKHSVAGAGTEASQLLALLQRLVAKSVKGCRFWVVSNSGTGWGLKPRPVALPSVMAGHALILEASQST